MTGFQTLGAIAALLFAFFAGAFWADALRANDYSIGWRSGYTAAQVDARNLPEAAVTKNMLCHYAELACVRPK